MLSKYYAMLMLVFLTRQTKSIRVDMGSDLNNYNTQYVYKLLLLSLRYSSEPFGCISPG
ncbi:hypothetical protein FHW36_101746 [Chitinophaga polysaccharea]|uniref:Uncharacterized protein n=1 Tax=Chitinophaga polysaccharea TaxID=1293035 RepID=A0A561Q376_9BACT|nr:hypothetical protein FHW36_101746 [Chitinophaga polysaccharea]